jgi:hypothetical protein
MYARPLVRTAADPVIWLQWLKSSEQHEQMSIVGVPSATFGTGSSTARRPAPWHAHNLCRRSAQDDDFVRVWTKTSPQVSACGPIAQVSLLRPGVLQEGLDLIPAEDVQRLGSHVAFRGFLPVKITPRDLMGRWVCQ